MKFLHLTWSNLKRRKMRTILTLLSVLMAFVLYGYLAAIRIAFTQGVDVAGADRLITRHRISLIQLLPASYKERIARISGVERVTHFTWFGGIYQDPKNFFGQMPVEPEEFLPMYPEMVLTPEEKKAWLETRTGAIAGRYIADRFKWKVGDRIPIQATIWPQAGGKTTWEFDLVGIYEGKEKGTDTTSFYFRYDYFDEARARGQGLVGWYGVKIKSPELAATVAEKIDQEFENSSAETKTEAEKAFVQSFAKQVGDIGLIMMVVLSAVFFTILLVTGNTMAQAVRERTEELGVLKALGFSNGTVLRLVLAESCLLSGLGGLSGLALARLLISAGDPTGGYLPIFFFPASDQLVGLAIVFGLGLASGLLPAVRAMRLRIADALRSA